MQRALPRKLIPCQGRAIANHTHNKAACECSSCVFGRRPDTMLRKHMQAKSFARQGFRALPSSYQTCWITQNLSCGLRRICFLGSRNTWTSWQLYSPSIHWDTLCASELLLVLDHNVIADTNVFRESINVLNWALGFESFQNERI